MSEHSPEPWRYFRHDDHGVERLPGSVYRADGHTIAKTIQFDTLANARRIVACVNACAGIPTALLEQGAMAFQGQAVLVVSGELSEMERHALRTAPPGSIVAIPSGTKIKIVGQPITENPTTEPL